MGTTQPLRGFRWRELEGHHVNILLASGLRLDGIEVVSAGRAGLSSLWLDQGGMDLFIDKALVTNVWEYEVAAA